jgi:hypothetical protein
MLRFIAQVILSAVLAAALIVGLCLYLVQPW